MCQCMDIYTSMYMCIYGEKKSEEAKVERYRRRNRMRWKNEKDRLKGRGGSTSGFYDAIKYVGH